MSKRTLEKLEFDISKINASSRCEIIFHFTSVSNKVTMLLIRLYVRIWACSVPIHPNHKLEESLHTFIKNIEIEHGSTIEYCIR